MNFRQNFSQKKFFFRHFRKKLSPRLLIAYPKAYAKETPFMDLLLNSHVYMKEFG